MKKDFIYYLKKFKHFIFEEDSILSWIVSVILAFVIIKFIVYPGLGLLLGTQYPIVAVVSSSMEHPDGFDRFWEINDNYYDHFNITREDFESFPSRNGFNKGDIMILISAKKVEIGDVIVFQSVREPIIHRVIKKWKDENGDYHYQTKGDNNPHSIKRSDLDETDITQDKILGKSAIRVPLLGWIKIGFVNLMNTVGVNIS